MSGSEGRVDFEEAGVAEQVGAIVSGQLVELGGGGENQVLVIVFIIAGLQRTASGLRDENGSAAHEVHDGGHMEDVLIVSGKEEDAVGADRTADGSAELVLEILRLEVEKGR